MAMLEHLLPAGADVLALDREGFPAIHHALQASHPKVTERLLDEMLKLPAAKLRKEPLASRIQGVWGAAHQASNPAMQGLVERFTELAKKCYTVASVHLHAIAHSGDVSAMRAAFARLPPEYVVLGWDVRGYDPVEGGDTEMLDLAILSGSAAMAKMVQDPEVHEGDLQLGCIHMHKDPQQIRKAVRHGQVARFRAYHKVKPPDAATMAALLVEACETEQLQMAFELWTLGGDSVQEALGTEAKEKLAELGGRAAALGHVDYLQLLVDAGVPLDHCMEGSRSMIIRAASAGRTQAVELLATARADLTTALPEAIGCGHGAAAEALLRRRADPHETWGDEPWESVVGQAIMTNRPEMLRLLADHGAESYTQEHLVFAEEEQAAECLELMRSHRAKGTQLEDQ